MKDIYALYIIADRMGGNYEDTFSRFEENIDNVKDWLNDGWSAAIRISIEESINLNQKSPMITHSKMLYKVEDLYNAIKT